MSSTTPTIHQAAQWHAIKGHSWARHAVSLETDGAAFKITTILFNGDHNPRHVITEHTDDEHQAAAIYKRERRFIRNVCPYELADSIS